MKAVGKKALLAKKEGEKEGEKVVVAKDSMGVVKKEGEKAREKEKEKGNKMELILLFSQFTPGKS